MSEMLHSGHEIIYHSFLCPQRNFGRHIVMGDLKKNAAKA